MANHYAQYTGDDKGRESGEFISGIPKRNLTRAEWEALTQDLQELALKSGLYKLNEQTPEKAGK